MEGGKKVKENWSFINIWKIVWFSLVLFVFVYWLRSKELNNIQSYYQLIHDILIWKHKIQIEIRNKK